MKYKSKYKWIYSTFPAHLCTNRKYIFRTLIFMNSRLTPAAYKQKINYIKKFNSLTVCDLPDRCYLRINYGNLLQLFYSNLNCTQIQLTVTTVLKVASTCHILYFRFLIIIFYLLRLKITTFLLFSDKQQIVYMYLLH